MFVSTRIASMSESATLAVSAKAAAARAKGHDVIAFAMGEPDFDTPDNIKRVAIEALEKGMTKYAPTPGDRAAREAIAAKLSKENGVATAFDQVTVTVGAKHAIYMALQAIIEPGRGDEVLLPTPAWVSYKPLIELAVARCVEVDDGLFVERIQQVCGHVDLGHAGPSGLHDELGLVLLGREAQGGGLDPHGQVLAHEDDVVAVGREIAGYGEDARVVIAEQ